MSAPCSPTTLSRGFYLSMGRTEAHEAGVETLPDFRGKGYARDVAAEWARRVRGLGAIPLYSTSWTNNASQAVARKLRLVCYGADFEVT